MFHKFSRYCSFWLFVVIFIITIILFTYTQEKLFATANKNTGTRVDETHFKSSCDQSQCVNFIFYGSCSIRMKVHHKMHQSAGELSELLSFPLDYCYKMNHRKRGLCLIFDQEAFTQLPERKGTKFDRIRLWDTFTALQFEVRLFGNQPKQEIMRILEKGKST